MTTAEQASFVRRAEEIYKSHWQVRLEQTHRNYFAAIEPESKECFLGKSLTEAGEAAFRAYPDRATHTIRVGHKTAIFIGGASR